MLTQNTTSRTVDYFVNRAKNFINWKNNKQSNYMHPIIQRWEHMKTEKLSLFYAKMILIDCFNLIGSCFNPDDPPAGYIGKDKKQSLQDKESEIMENIINRCFKTFEENKEDIHSFCIDVVEYNY